MSKEENQSLSKSQNEPKVRGAFDKNPELIRRYREGDEQAGEELVRLNEPLVYSIAARFKERTNDVSDLYECGTLGLVKAIRTFDHTRGCAFSTYAVPLIFGEIRRFLRDDGMIKVSREEKRLSRALSAERDRRKRENLPLDIASIAEAVGVSVKDAASAMFSELPVRSFEEYVYDDDSSLTLGNTIEDEASLSSVELISLRYEIERLPEEQKRLIVLRYFKDLSQQLTAKALGLSQVKVSREEKKIIEHLRTKLAKSSS